MTKKDFFEEHVGECFGEVSGDLEKVCEAIRRDGESQEEEFYEELYDSCSDAHYSIVSGFQMFSDSIDMETMLDVDSEILNWDISNKIYQKAANDTRTLQEVYDAAVEKSSEAVSNITNDIHSILCSGYADLTQSEQREYNENLFEYMISIYERLASKVWYASADEEDSYGNAKYYIIVSDSVEFNV